MKYNHDQHHRRSIRLQGYDYSQNGAYFVTICTHSRECLFGGIIDGQMVMNNRGMTAHDEWVKTVEMRENIELDEFVVMPNHIHGIIVIHDGRGTMHRAPTAEQFGKPTSKSIPTIIRGLKSAVTKRINGIRKTPGFPVWQRNYYEHIIRDEQSMEKIREYIVNNPLNWERDEMHQPCRGAAHQSVG